jgi:hypothetical protein
VLHTQSKTLARHVDGGGGFWCGDGTFNQQRFFTLKKEKGEKCEMAWG